jgi:hypothetical protein
MFALSGSDSSSIDEHSTDLFEVAPLLNDVEGSIEMNDFNDFSWMPDLQPPSQQVSDCLKSSTDVTRSLSLPSHPNNESGERVM